MINYREKNLAVFGCHIHRFRDANSESFSLGECVPRDSPSRVAQIKNHTALTRSDTNTNISPKGHNSILYDLNVTFARNFV